LVLPSSPIVSCPKSRGAFRRTLDKQLIIRIALKDWPKTWYEV
jgi:hypothetical protein